MDTLPPRRYIIADTETTGLGSKLKPKKACEIALLEIDPVTLQTIWEYDTLIDPQQDIEPGAVAIHGITQEMVADAPTIEELIGVVWGGKKQHGRVTLICHNVGFDRPLLEPIFDEIERSVCTLLEARSHIRDSANHKLQTLREHFGFPENEAHRALADCYTTRRILGEILRLTGKTLDQIADLKERTIHVQPWGCHKGRPIMEIPTDYLDWMLGLEDLEIHHRKSVQKVRALRG